MSKELRIAAGLTLPLEAVTQAIGILAKRRAGKSYTMRRLTEQLLKAGQQVVVVDPKGDQWGLRSAADGVSPGLPVVILGGERADVPLEVHSGEIVAKLVVEDRVSVLLDLSLFRKHEVATFMSAFLENLYRLKAREIYRTPLMLVIDEADAIAPQKPQKGEERMLGAAEDIVRRGGQRGIGCTLITQRSAVLNKNVLTQVQILVVLRTIAPQDLAAIDAWIDVHGTDEERKLLKGSLPSLPQGDAWFWSPGWPTVEGIFQRVHVLPIETFDSGATPKPGEKRIEPKNLADVDLDVLKKQMAATIEKAKAENPKELQKQIRDLKAELHKAQKTTPAAKPVEVQKVVEKHVLKDGQLARAENVLKRVEADIETLTIVAEGLKASLAKVSVNGHGPANATRVTRQGPIVTREPIRIDAPKSARHEGSLPEGEARILAALIQYPNGLTRGTIGALTGYTKRSTRNTYLQRLGQKGLVQDAGEKMIATDSGLAALPNCEPLPSGLELQQYWLSRLPDGERKILEVLIGAYPAEMTREAVSEQTGYDKRSTRNTYIQRLSQKELVTGREDVRASDNLFLDA